jgi:hypothetical protein
MSFGDVSIDVGLPMAPVGAVGAAEAGLLPALPTGVGVVGRLVFEQLPAMAGVRTAAAA